MAGKSRVGSLYYEIVLDPSKFKKGGKEVAKDARRLQKTLAEANKNADQKAVLAKRLEEEKAAIKRSLKAKRISWDEAKKLQKAAISNHEFAMRKIEKNERMSLKRRKVRANKAREAESNAAQTIANKMLGDEAREQKRLDTKYRAYLKNRHDVQRRWNKRKVANEKAAAQKIANLRKTSFAGGLFGTGSIAQGFGKLAAGASKLTSALFPLALIGYSVAKAWGVALRSLWAVIKAGDERKKQMLVLTTLMHGNEAAATRLRDSLVEYAKATAFSIKETTDLAIAMKALGFQAEEIPKVMAKLGRLSFGDGGKLKLIAKAYSDVKAQGKLLMTEVRQFANQGVPLLAQLQLNLGLTALETRDMMKKGLIGFEEVEAAVSQIAESYGNVDTAGLETLSGQLEAASEAAGELISKFGKSESLVVFGRLINGMIDQLDYYFVTLDANLDSILARIPKIGLALVALNSYMGGGNAQLEESERSLKAMQDATYKRLKFAEMQQKVLDNELSHQEAMYDIETQRYKAKLASRDALNGTDTLGDFTRREEENKELLEAEESVTKYKLAALAQLAKVRDTYSADEFKARKQEIEGQYEAEKRNLDAHIRYKHEAQAVAREREVKADADAAAKKAKDEADKAKEAARRIAEDKRKMHLDDIKKAAGKFRDEAQANIKKFDDDQANRDKLRGMAPATAPSFTAGSVEEHQFLKDRETQKENRRWELAQEEKRKKFIVEQNIELANNIAIALAANPIVLDGNENQDVFEAVE